ncbi:MAG: glycosyltransferase [Arenicellales bacterium]
MVTRLLIVEEALKNRNGHWYEYNKAILEEARSRGIEVTLLVHKDIEKEICDELGATPWFPATSWDQVYCRSNSVIRYFGFLRHNFLVARWMTRHFRKNPPYDIVLVPTVVLYHWLAWRWLIIPGSGSWFKKAVLTIRTNVGKYDPDNNSYSFNLSTRIFGKILKTFKHSVKNNKVVFATDSNKLAEQYQLLSGIPFRTFPHPRTIDNLPVRDRNDINDKCIVISALGPPRYEKGSDLIIGAMSKLIKHTPQLPLKFVLHWNKTDVLHDGNGVSISDEIKESDNVEIIRNNMSSHEYQKRIDETDLMLLPYRRHEYHDRLSGVAIEAFQSGASCICISNTWIEDCMKEVGSGISIKEESVDSLTRGILKYIENCEKYKSLANNNIQSARNFHSSAAFIDALFDIQPCQFPD